jgi:hypothetical protein
MDMSPLFDAARRGALIAVLCVVFGSFALGLLAGWMFWA